MRLHIDRRVGGFPKYRLTSDPGRLDVVPPEILKGVLFLCPSHPLAPAWNPEPGGTGFFVRYLEDGLAFVYVVTARHVVDGIGNDNRDRQLEDIVHLRLNARGGGCRYVGTPRNDWYTHPGDDPVDVAVLPFDRTALNDFDVDFFPLRTTGQPPFPEWAAPTNIAGLPDVANSQRAGPGDEVVIAGLFKNHYGQGRNVPLVRMGNIAAMPDEPVMVGWPDQGTKRPMTAFLVDTRSIRGLSGSPVYVNLPDERPRNWKEREPGGGYQYIVSRPATYYLLGLVHGHFNVPVPDTDYATEGDAPGTATANAGVCIVVPIERLLETLQHPALVERRRAAVAEGCRNDGATVADGTGTGWGYRI